MRHKNANKLTNDKVQLQEALKTNGEDLQSILRLSYDENLDIKKNNYNQF